MPSRRIRISPAACLALLGALLAATGSARADFGLSFFGTADSIGAVNSNVFYVLKAKRVPANNVIKFEFTNNGAVIVNKDGSHFGFQGQNTANVPANSEETLVKYMGKAVRTFNGLDITDTTTTLGGKLASNTGAGFFKPGGGMADLATALASAGYGNSLLDYPAFTSDLGQATPPPLYIGVDLQKWVSGGGMVADGDVGSLYQVTNGAVTSLLSGTGPGVDELSGFFFSSTPLSASSTSYTGTPFTGEVAIGSISEVGLGVPEPASLALLGTGVAGLAAPILRRRASRPIAR